MLRALLVLIVPTAMLPACSNADGGEGEGEDGGEGEAEGEGEGDGEGEGEGAPYRWESLTLPPDGPIGRWGFMVAPIGGPAAILFGGTSIDAVAGGQTFDDTWRIDLGGPEPGFERVVTQDAPDPRYCGCLAFDPPRNRIVLVGGLAERVMPPQTWALDLESATWTELELSGSPPGSVGCAMVYSTNRDALYVFGGSDVVQYYDRTYRLDPGAESWTELEARGPSFRYDALLKELTPGGPLVLFGGAFGATGTMHADIWQFDPVIETWSELGAEGGPPAGRRGGWMVVEPDGSGFLIGYGTTGVQPTEIISDLWRFDLGSSEWTDITPGERPPARGFSLHIPAGPGRIGLLLGGFDNLRPVSDLYRLMPADDDQRW